MQLNLTDDEIILIYKLRKFLRHSATRSDIFMDFIYERMVKVYGESELYDYMHKLAEWRDMIAELSQTLDKERH